MASYDQVWSLREAESGARALEMLYEENGVDALVIESVLPDLIPEELCHLVVERFPATRVLILDVESGELHKFNTVAADLMKLLKMLLRPAQTKPLQIMDPELLRETWTPHISQWLHASHSHLDGMVGDSERMRIVYELAHMVAARTTTVLVTGESGTGKDLVAQAIHGISNRAKHPFIIVNCAAVPEALLEAELFGYAKGAFTGAMQSRIGRIHAAHGGTLFLDEIGDMPLVLQSKILRFLEQGEVQRLGSNDNVRVDVRVVAATNCELKTLTKRKMFREDLYYRLAVFLIHLPPLRERKGDIPQLVRTFAMRYCSGAVVHPSVIDKLSEHHWPGNVRELRNVMERASILIRQEREITLDHIML